MMFSFVLLTFSPPSSLSAAFLASNISNGFSHEYIHCCGCMAKLSFSPPTRCWQTNNPSPAKVASLVKSTEAGSHAHVPSARYVIEQGG
jgi:hypothetical protein